METETPKATKTLSAKRLISTLVILLVVATGTGIYFYQKATADPQKVAQKELDQALSQIGKLIVLPQNETPTLATVSDPEKLKDQAFFANAKKGDKVLIYTLARKAILYSVSLNKIIEVAPVNSGEVGAPSPKTVVPLQKK
jgi:hypothetical protein